MDLPPVHLSIVQPAGYVHSLGLLDPARYLRHQLRRVGAQVTMAKNRLRHDAVNFVFGAHLGFDASLRQRYSCIFVNLEQIGDGGAAVSPAYLELLRSSAVIDYDPDNVAAYAGDPADVPIAPIWHAPYLQPQALLPLDERPIDLLFFGSMNPRRRAMLERIEACGRTVVTFDSPLYGPERDEFIKQARAVVNLHYYPSARFEQVRVSHCLSLGTPVVCERGARAAHPVFEETVSWFDETDLEAFFGREFGSPAWQQAAQAGVQAFRAADPIEHYADVMAFACGFAAVHREQRPQGPWRPTQLNLGSGKSYKPGWLNLDVLDRAEPDLLLDLAQPQQWPLSTRSAYAGALELHEGQLRTIFADNVLEHVADLPQLMTSCLTLLETGGRFEIVVPYEHAATAWQDPTHVRALNENSWIYYTDWFWYLGWFAHRFSMVASCYRDLDMKEAPRERAAFMQVTLEKVETTLQERMVARTMQPDFGGLADDPLPSRVTQQATTEAMA